MAIFSRIHLSFLTNKLNVYVAATFACLKKSKRINIVKKREIQGVFEIPTSSDFEHLEPYRVSDTFFV